PEYGPLGATSPTSFANVDLAQVATPAAPASGFSRLFASAVDSQLWYELPTGRLIPVSQQAKLQLWSVVSTDLVNGIAAATGAWTDLTTNTAFSTEDSASLVEVSVQATIQVVMGGAAGTVGLRLSLDNDSRIADLAAKVFTSSQDDFVCGNAALKIDQLATGGHNLKLEYFASQAATLFLRAASTNFES